MKCVLCKKEIPPQGTWKEGNNAEPVAKGRCCNDCNMTKVVPARIKHAMELK